MIINNKIWLQGIGLYPAIMAKDIIPGMVLVWNYGYKSKVISTEKSKTGNSVYIITESNRKQYKRRFSGSTLLAIDN